jgi:pimeloyl-ACP methyl ester carboxylesterase
MANILINGCNYYYEDVGKGDETIVFSHGLLWNNQMFVNQINHLKNKYRIISYDHRGQGLSQVTENGYGMDSLYQDVHDLIKNLGINQVHFVGLSMGGFVAMRIAARNPELIRSLILMETSAQTEPNKIKYWFLNTIVKLFGVGLVVKSVMKIMFGQKFLTDKDRTPLRDKLRDQLKSLDKSIVKAVEGVINRKAIDNELHKIKCPTLIMVGTQDIATVPAKAEYIHQMIPHSTLKYIDGAGHTSSMEEPEQVNDLISEFLNNLSS